MRWYKTSKWIQIIFMLVLGAFVVTPLVWVIFQSLENTVAYDVNNVFLFIRQYLSFGLFLRDNIAEKVEQLYLRCDTTSVLLRRLFLFRLHHLSV